MNGSLQGVLPILNTPFTEDDRIDEESLRAMIDAAYRAGVNGCCMAMVSELLRLTREERLFLSRALVEMNAGRGAVVISVGAETIKDAVGYAEKAADAGADALMAIPPVTVALPESGLEEYFSAIAGATTLPLIVQDASGYVGRAMSVAFQADLCNRFGPEKILFKPEANPVGPMLTALKEATGGRAQIFEGSGGLLLVENHRRGITGTMPGCEMIEAMVALWKALEAGDEKRVYALYFPICAVVALQAQAGLDSFIAIEKYILCRKGLIASERRRKPYAYELDAHTRGEIDRLLAQLAWAVENG